MSMMVNCVLYDRVAGKRVRDLTLAEIPGVLADTSDTFVWVGLHEPDEALMLQVQQAFDLHELAVEDAHRAHQRPKLERYGKSIFVTMHTARMEGEDIRFGETHAFLGPRYLVTIRHGASASYASVRTRYEQNPELVRYGPGYVLYAIIDFVVDNYFPVVEDFRHHLQTLEGAIFGGTFQRKTIRHLYELKGQLIKLQLAFTPLQDVCNELTHFEQELIPHEIRPYFRDVHDHVLRINDAVDALSEMLSAALDVNLALVTVGQNEVVKRLASWAAILAVPTLIASLYGMNFQDMPELGWHYGYPVVIAGMVLVSAGLYVKLRKSKWL